MTFTMIVSTRTVTGESVNSATINAAFPGPPP